MDGQGGTDKPDRCRGRVRSVGADFGFIVSDDMPQDVYFRPSWYRGQPPLREGDQVTFEVRSYGTKVNAFSIVRAGDIAPPTPTETELAEPSSPVVDNLMRWAYLGYLPSTLQQLANLALRERWEFKNSNADPSRPVPILLSYLLNTFGRLVLEDKVCVVPVPPLAVFNTGLVDRRYEPIYAVFGPNDLGRPQRWQLTGFCIAGEGPLGQQLVRHFNPLPAPAHYFDQPSDLLYDTRVGKPEMDWRHVVIDRIDRYPSEFIEEHWPSGMEVQDLSGLPHLERVAYWHRVGEAVEADNRTYRTIINRVRDAVDLSVKRVGWNFKTAVPQYYPKVRRLQLLLPINLVSDDEADMALAVERTPSGSYLGHTVLALDWAYQNARLICRPDSDWLSAEEIDEIVDEEVDEN